MLKFFRRIRWKLLSKDEQTEVLPEKAAKRPGRLRKYLLYAVGEILLVVIGILIALQINNWNETQKKQETIKVYLENYVKDLQDDKERMERLMSINAFRYHALQYLLSMAGEDAYIPDYDVAVVPPDTVRVGRWQRPIPKEYDQAFVELAFVYSHRKQSHELNLSTINELKSVGLYSYMDNPRLKESINSYYSEWNWRIGEENAQVERELIEKWQDSWADDGMITSNIFVVDDPIGQLQKHPRRVYLLRRLIREAAWLASCASIVMRNADDLIAVVQEEIDRYAH